MSRRFAVVGAAQLVTVKPTPEHPLGAVRDGAMLVEDGTILAVGARDDVANRIGADWDVVDAKGRLVIPGFVDAHTHPAFGGDRADEFAQRAAGATYQQIAAAGGGIRSTVAKTRMLSEDDLFRVAERRAHWFLRTGTTTIEAKSGYGLDLETELRLLRAIQRLDRSRGGPLSVTATFLGAHAVPPEYEGRAEAYAGHVAEEMIPEVARLGLAEWCDVFCEPGYFDLRLTRVVLESAKRHGLKLRVHADQLTRSGGAELAAELGAKTADHLEQLDRAGIEALRAGGVQPVLLPGSVFCLGHDRYPDARGMLDAGLAVVLATDFNPGSSPTCSMPFVLTLACTQMGMTPEEAVIASTLHAARSLDRERDRGSLEPSKRADFAILDCDDYREIPYWVGLELVDQTFVQGEPAFDRSRPAAKVS